MTGSMPERVDRFTSAPPHASRANQAAVAALAVSGNDNTAMASGDNSSATASIGDNNTHRQVAQLHRACHGSAELRTAARSDVGKPGP